MTAVWKEEDSVGQGEEIHDLYQLLMLWVTQPVTVEAKLSSMRI